MCLLVRRIAGRAVRRAGVGQISERAGFSRPTFYAHFRDKRELLLQRAAARPSCWRWPRHGSRPGTGDLRATLEGVLQAFRRHSATVAALVEGATYDEEVAAFWRGFHELFVRSARDRAMSEAPDLDVRAAEALAFALVWMTERAFTENIATGRVDDDALLDAMERLWRSGVGAEQ